MDWNSFGYVDWKKCIFKPSSWIEFPLQTILGHSHVWIVVVMMVMMFTRISIVMLVTALHRFIRWRKTADASCAQTNCYVQEQTSFLFYKAKQVSTMPLEGPLVFALGVGGLIKFWFLNLSGTFLRSDLNIVPRGLETFVRLPRLPDSNGTYNVDAMVLHLIYFFSWILISFFYCFLVLLFPCFKPLSRQWGSYYDHRKSLFFRHFVPPSAWTCFLAFLDFPCCLPDPRIFCMFPWLNDSKQYLDSKGLLTHHLFGGSITRSESSLNMKVMDPPSFWRRYMLLFMGQFWLRDVSTSSMRWAVTGISMKSPLLLVDDFIISLCFNLFCWWSLCFCFGKTLENNTNDCFTNDCFSGTRIAILRLILLKVESCQFLLLQQVQLWNRTKIFESWSLWGKMLDPTKLFESWSLWRREKNVESDKDPRKLESVRERKKTMEGVVIDERVCDWWVLLLLPS